MELHSSALEPITMHDIPELKLQRHWRWYRCIPIVLLVMASSRLGFQFGLHQLTMPTLLDGFGGHFDCIFTSIQVWLEGPDRILELLIAYTIILIVLFVMIIAIFRHLLDCIISIL